MNLQPPARKDAVIYDLDGTLVDTMRYEAHHKHKHMGFAKEALNAEPIDENVEKLKEDQDKGRSIVILTARSAHYRRQTEHWLKKHDIQPDMLVMRPATDHETPDSKIKKKLLKEKIDPVFNPIKAYDDKKKNVKMFKKQGIKAKKV